MKKQILSSILLIILFSISISEFTYGQGYRTFRWEQKRIIEQSLWKLGPFRIEPRIQLRNIGYDDNVYYERENENPVNDYTAAFSPEVKAHLLVKDFFIFSFTENPEYVFYLKEKRERRWNNTLSPEFKLLLLNQFVLSGSYLYRNRRWRATSEFDVRANELRNRYEGSLFYETARRTSLGISVYSEKISYEDVKFPGREIYLSRFLNRKEEGGSVEFDYRVFSESFFFLKGGYAEYDFEHPESDWRDSYSYQGYMGVQFPLLGKIRGIISLGYKNLIPKSENKRSFSGIVGDTGVDFRIGRFRFQLQYKRDARFSYSSNNIYYIEDLYGAGLSFYLTRFLRLDYNFSYKEGDYPEKITVWDPVEGNEEIQRQDQYYSHSFGCVIRIIQNTGIGVRLGYWERDSNIYWAERDRMFIGGYLTYDF